MYIYCIIPLYNRVDLTKKLFNCLLKQTLYKKLKIIFIDDGSKDETKAFLEKNKEKIFLSLNGDGNLFWGGCINLALKEIKHLINPKDYVILFNNDTKFNTLFIQQLVKESNNGKYIVASYQQSASGEYNGGYFIDFPKCRIHPKINNEPVNAAIGRGLLLPANTLKDLSRINTLIYKSAFGDIHFTNKLNDLGWGIISSKKAITTETDISKNAFEKAKEKNIFQYFDFRNDVVIYQWLYFFSTQGPLVLRFTGIFRIIFFFLVRKVFKRNK